MNPNQIDCSQRDDDHDCPNHCRVITKWQYFSHVIAKDKSQQGDGSSVDDGSFSPAIQKRNIFSVCFIEEMVIAASVWIHGSEFGITKRACQRDDGACYPDRHHPSDVACNASHHGRRLKNPRSNDDPNNNGDRT